MSIFDRALDLVGLARRGNTAPAGRTSSGAEVAYDGSWDYEKTPSLRGRQRWDTYDQMENDARVSEAIRAIVQPLQTADWRFVPQDEENKAEVEFAELCNANLLSLPGDVYGEEYFQETPWKAQRLPEVLRMIAHGYSIQVMTPKTLTGPGGKTAKCYSRAQWIEPLTMAEASKQWEIDDRDRVLGIYRTYTMPNGNRRTDEFIPASRLKLYTWDMYGNRVEGRAFIRPMYGAWYRKDFVQKRGLLWIQKVAAGSALGLYPPDWDQEDIERFKQFIRGTRGSSPDKIYGAFPRTADGQEPVVSFVGSEHKDVDRVGSVVDGENREIAHAGGQKMMSLGEGNSSGNRALGEIMGATEAIQSDAVIEVVAAWMTYGCMNIRGEVRELRDWNYPSVQKLPRLICTKPDPLAASRAGQDFISGWEKGIVPHDPSVRQQFTERYGYKITDPEAYEIDEDAAPAPGTETSSSDRKAQSDESTNGPGGQSPPGGEGAGGGDSDGDDGAQPPEGEGDRPRSRVAASRLSDEAIRRGVESLMRPAGGGAGDTTGGFREVNRLEAAVLNLAAIQRTFTQQADAAVVVLVAAEGAMTRDLTARLRAGKITRRSVPSQMNSRFKGDERTARELEVVLNETAEIGMIQVQGEVQRVSRMVERPEPDPADVMIAAASKKNRRKSKKVVKETAAISIAELWERWRHEFLTEFDRLSRQGYDLDEIERRILEHLDELSPKRTEDLGRRSTAVAYSAGRDAEHVTAWEAGEIDIVLRSEVLDVNTCDPCEDLDGSFYEVGSEAYYEHMPPSFCVGGDRCRGLYIGLPDAIGSVA